MLDDPSRQVRAGIGCTGCGAMLATLRHTKPAGPHGYPVFRLETGYVNAKRRHPSGDPWYLPGKRQLAASPPARRPLVITCRCGKETQIPAN